MTVKEAVIKFLGSECLVENIPSDKLQKAVDYIAYSKVSVNDIVAVYDATLFGSMKKGFVVTQDTIYFSSYGGVPFNAISLVRGWNKADAMTDGKSNFEIYKVGRPVTGSPWIELRDSYLIGPAGDRCAQFLNMVCP